MPRFLSLPTLLLASLLVLMLPLQFAWGAAAAYCQHETTQRGAAHVGHHEHVHTNAAEKTSAGQTLVDADCSVCNTAAPHALPHATRPLPVRSAGTAVADDLPAAVTSAFARAPDRPQWLRLA